MATNPGPSPFPLEHALNQEGLREQRVISGAQTASNVQISYVPGQPSVGLTPSDVHGFLIEELQTSVLDELYPRLWGVARKSSKSIDPLDRQQTKGRKIVPSEDPKLHLVWQRNKIYIKPIPVCFFNYEFWNSYLASSKNLTAAGNRYSHRPAALGFMRSYSYLIQHRLDFIFAQQHHLIPAQVDWIEWSIFIAHFRLIDDEQVALRYHYGQLRLSRLDWAVRIFQPRNAPSAWFYEIPYWSTVLYLKEALGPLVFIFASLSVVLSSMQVVLSVPSEGLWSDESNTTGLRAVRQAFWVFSIMVLLLSGTVWALMLVIPVTVLGWQLQWGLRNRVPTRGTPSC